MSTSIPSSPLEEKGNPSLIPEPLRIPCRELAVAKAAKSALLTLAQSIVDKQSMNPANLSKALVSTGLEERVIQKAQREGTPFADLLAQVQSIANSLLVNHLPIVANVMIACNAASSDADFWTKAMQTAAFEPTEVLVSDLDRIAAASSASMLEEIKADLTA